MQLFNYQLRKYQHTMYLRSNEGTIGTLETDIIKEKTHDQISPNNYWYSSLAVTKACLC